MFFGITELQSIRRHAQGLGHGGLLNPAGEVTELFKQRSYPIIEIGYLYLIWCLAQHPTITGHINCLGFEF